MIIGLRRVTWPSGHLGWVNGSALLPRGAACSRREGLMHHTGAHRGGCVDGRAVGRGYQDLAAWPPHESPAAVTFATSSIGVVRLHEAAQRWLPAPPGHRPDRLALSGLCAVGGRDNLSVHWQNRKTTLVIRRKVDRRKPSAQRQACAGTQRPVSHWRLALAELALVHVAPSELAVVRLTGLSADKRSAAAHLTERHATSFLGCAEAIAGLLRTHAGPKSALVPGQDAFFIDPGAYGVGGCRIADWDGRGMGKTILWKKQQSQRSPCALRRSALDISTLHGSPHKCTDANHRPSRCRARVGWAVHPIASRAGASCVCSQSAMVVSRARLGHCR